MLKFAITNKKLFLISTILLTNKIAKNSESSQLENRQLVDQFSAGEAVANANAPLLPMTGAETYSIPAYDDPLY